MKIFSCIRIKLSAEKGKTNLGNILYRVNKYNKSKNYAMKTKILQMSAILIAIMLTTPMFADVITKETFGTVSFDANPDPFDPAYNGSNSSTGYWWLVDYVADYLTTENGYWAAGSDTSIRINDYVVQAGSETKTWTDTSSVICLHMTAHTRYGGAWDTTYLMGINVKGYEDMELQFGWGKRYNGWVAYDDTIRGLKVEYRLDGGSWTMFDTTKLENPLDGDTWSLAEKLYVDGTGDVLDIMFTACHNNNQIGIDDVILLGTPVGGSSIKDEQLLNVNVYPNPVADELNIQLKSGVNGNYKIVTITGIEIQQGVINNGFEKIDISNLNSGIYLISITSEGLQNTVRFIK